MKKGLFLIAILLVPSIIYLLFSLGQHHAAKIGFEGRFVASLDGDTSYLPLAIQPLISSKKNVITSDSLTGKVVLLHFFHSPCPEECKTEFATINNYLNEIGKNDQWMLLNICLDSITMGELEALSSKKLYNGSNWFYCKSEEFEVVTTMFSEAFDSPRNQIKQATSTVVLLDQTQHVRARFNLKLQPEIKLLQDAIKLLIKEPHIAWKNKK